MSTMPLTPEYQEKLDKAQLALDTGKQLTPEQKNLLTQLGSPDTIKKVSVKTTSETTGTESNYTSFEKSKYNVSHTAYPTDLLTNPIYGKNYVIYYINEYDGISTSSSKNDTVSDATMGISNASGSKSNGVGATVATASAAATTITSIATGGFSLGNIVKSVAKGLGVGAAAGTFAEYMDVSVAGTTRKRLKTAIALPIPNDVSFSESYDWRTSDSALMGAGYDAIASQLSNLVTGDGSALNSAKSIGGTSINGLMTKISSALPTQKALMRQTVNEKQEVLFNGVEHRNFTHTFQFAATSKEEVENIDKIIKTLRYHAANDYVDEMSFIMVYPSDFDVMYFHGKSENKYIPKHPSCVLTNISTNLSPNSLFATFDGGAPIMINLTLQFKELAIISKKEIKKGY